MLVTGMRLLLPPRNGGDMQEERHGAAEGSMGWAMVWWLKEVEGGRIETVKTDMNEEV